jgi:subtilase family serine protease
MGQEAGACRWHLTGYAAVAVPLSSWLPFSLLAFGCASSARPPVPVSLPVPRSGQITFYLSLPSSTSALGEAVDRVAAPGSSQYRHFTSPDQAARQFGASDAQITAVARAISRLGLRFAADPTRLFGRVTGSARQWKAALRAPLSTQAATASSPFTTYTLPAHTPGALQPKGATLLTRQTEVYDRAAEGSRPPSVPGTTLSYPAVSPYITAVGGTRLALGPGNTRVSEVVCGTTRCMASRRPVAAA